MGIRQRFTELRIPRTSPGRHRSLAGGVVTGDYVDPANGERVVVVKTVPIVRPAAGAKKKARTPSAELFTDKEAPVAERPDSA